VSEIVYEIVERMVKDAIREFASVLVNANISEKTFNIDCYKCVECNVTLGSDSEIAEHAKKGHRIKPISLEVKISIVEKAE